MANEHLVIQEEYLQEVIIVIESGILLSKDSVSKETKQNLQNWCDLHKRNIFQDVLKKYFEIISDRTGNSFIGMCEEKEYGFTDEEKEALYNAYNES